MVGGTEGDTPDDKGPLHALCFRKMLLLAPKDKGKKWMFSPEEHQTRSRRNPWSFSNAHRERNRTEPIFRRSGELQNEVQVKQRRIYRYFSNVGLKEMCIDYNYFFKGFM